MRVAQANLSEIDLVVNAPIVSQNSTIIPLYIIVSYVRSQTNFWVPTSTSSPCAVLAIHSSLNPCCPGYVPGLSAFREPRVPRWVRRGSTHSQRRGHRYERRDVLARLRNPNMHAGFGVPGAVLGVGDPGKPSRTCSVSTNRSAN